MRSFAEYRQTILRDRIIENVSNQNNSAINEQNKNITSNVKQKNTLLKDSKKTK